MNESHAFAPALSGFVRPPGAVLAIAELHLHAVLATIALWRCLLALGFCLSMEPLQQGLQPCQQALFVAVAQRHLHLAPCQRDVDVAAHRCLRERHCGDRRRGVRLHWRWLAWCLSLAVARTVKLGQLVLGQCRGSLVNPVGDTVTVDARVAPHTSASKPCVRVSPHTAPQLLALVMGTLHFRRDLVVAVAMDEHKIIILVMPMISVYVVNLCNVLLSQ